MGHHSAQPFLPPPMATHHERNTDAEQRGRPLTAAALPRAGAEPKQPTTLRSRNNPPALRSHNERGTPPAADRPGRYLASNDAAPEAAVQTLRRGINPPARAGASRPRPEPFK